MSTKSVGDFALSSKSNVPFGKWLAVPRDLACLVAIILIPTC